LNTNVRAAKRARVVAITCALGVVSCNHPTGPSLTAVIESQTLVPTSSVPFAESICCCHVTGTVRNTSSVSVDIILDWTASDASGKPLGLATDFAKNVAPGASAPFDAAGIFSACSLVKNIVPTVTVIGIYQPVVP
jgi:hypothetical protein